ncbi:MAG: MobA/MobL family protein [Oscillospiraceae bacterium]|nr:MobA/MobL family protein [Oscillospiraceae bacterium]
MIALPNELNLDEQIKLVREYVNDNLTSRGLCADVAIHHGHRHLKDKQDVLAKNDNIITPNNPHAHILFSTRYLTKEGFKNKDRTLESPKNVYKWRESWAKTQNRELEARGIDTSKLSHESYVKQGLDKEGQLHLGHEAAALEKQGIKTNKGNENRAIQERNRQKEERQKQREIERQQNRNRERNQEQNRDLSR